MAGLPATAVSRPHPLRRSRPRYTLRLLAYVKLDHANGGIIRDITEHGLALQAVTPLNPGDSLKMRFDLLSPRVHLEVEGRVAWADDSGQAGIAFSQLPFRQARALRDWILLQMLSAAVLTGRDSMFAPLEEQLVLSTAPRPAILVAPERPSNAAEWIEWGVFSLSPRSFSILVDSLVLTCAILVFCISSIAVMRGLPPWPLATTLLAVVSAIFVATYHLLFSDFLCGATPGKRLAEAAAGASSEPPDGQRFR